MQDNHNQSPSEFWEVISPNDLRACLEDYIWEKAKKLLGKNKETFLYKTLKYKYIIIKVESYWWL